MNGLKLIIKTILTLICFFSTVIQPQGNWEFKTPIPTARKEIPHSAVSMGEIIYVIGGIEITGTISNLNEIYDSANDSWSLGEPLPQSVWRASAAVFNGKIYVFGGYLTTTSFPFTPSDKVYEYNPITDSWSQKTNMLSVRGSSAAVTLGDSIYIIGGSSSSALSSIHIYDPVNDVWSVGEPMPTSRSGLTAVVIENKIYVAGGYFLSGGVVPLDILEMFDPGTGNWVTLNAMPVERLGIGSAVVNQKMYVFGGLPTDTISRALEYDPQGYQWQELSDMPTPVSFMGVTNVGNSIYVIGGGPENLNRFDAVNLNRLFIPPPITSVDNDAMIKPLHFYIDQNYPNPFNPSTTIEFSIPSESFVTLVVFNSLGQEVSKLVGENKPAGQYSVSFNADGLPSGIYLYRLSSGNFIETKKMILLR